MRSNTACHFKKSILFFQIKECFQIPFLLQYLNHKMKQVKLNYSEIFISVVYSILEVCYMISHIQLFSWIIIEYIISDFISKSFILSKRLL